MNSNKPNEKRLHRRDMLLAEYMAFQVNPAIEKAENLHRPYNSHHEAFAVLKEEAEEAWAEVKEREASGERILDELKDIIVVASRWAVSILEEKADGRKS